MATLDWLPVCCGINELGYIRDDDNAVDSLMSIHKGDLAAHVVFSVTSRECVKHAKGIALAKYIRKHKLGSVVSTKPAVNPNHKGTLRAWLWTPNKKTFIQWQAAQRKAHPQKYGVTDYNPWGW